MAGEFGVDLVVLLGMMAMNDPKSDVENDRTAEPKQKPYGQTSGYLASGFPPYLAVERCSCLYSMYCPPIYLGVNVEVVFHQSVVLRASAALLLTFQLNFVEIDKNHACAA